MMCESVALRVNPGALPTPEVLPMMVIVPAPKVLPAMVIVPVPKARPAMVIVPDLKTLPAMVIVPDLKVPLATVPLRKEKRAQEPDPGQGDPRVKPAPGLFCELAFGRLKRLVSFLVITAYARHLCPSP